MTLKRVLGIDVGYGHCKIVSGLSDGTIEKEFKFPSKIAVTKKLEYVDDSRIYTYKGHAFYVGENANHSPSDNLVDITEYANLEYYAPLFLYHAIQQLDEKPDVIVAGLSIAQIGNSGYFQAALQEFEVNEEEYKFDNVFVLPQGAGAKLSIDKYGHNFPITQQEYLGETTYVIADIGNNTVDLVLVSNGKTSPNLFEGIEKEGVMKISTKIAKKVHEHHGRSITLQEANDIIVSGVYKLRGKSYPFKEYVDEVKKEYLSELLKLIESRYGQILDKCSFISVSGGGSYMFKASSDGFIRVPNGHNEFLNSIGQYLYGCQKS